MLWISQKRKQKITKKVKIAYNNISEMKIRRGRQNVTQIKK